MSERYFIGPNFNGFVVNVGNQPVLIVVGRIACPWDDAATAIKHGWRLKGGLANGSVILERQSA